MWLEAINNANDDAQTHFDCPAGSGADDIMLGSTIFLDVLSYEGEVTAGFINGLGSPVDFVERSATLAVDAGTGSLVRIPDGNDTENAVADWILTATPTPGDENLP